MVIRNLLTCSDEDNVSYIISIDEIISGDIIHLEGSQPGGADEEDYS